MTATSAEVKVKVKTYSPATLYYTVKTAPVDNITPNDVALDTTAKNVAVNTSEEIAISLGDLTIATPYYTYFVAQNECGFSEVDSAVFTTPSAFAKRPSVDTASATATTVRISARVSLTSTLRYTVKTAPIPNITPDDIASDADGDSVAANAKENITISLSGLTKLTTYYAYFTVQSSEYGFSEVDTLVFTTPLTMMVNSGFERWTGENPDGWTTSGSVAKDTVATEGQYSARVDAIDSRIDLKQTVYGVEAGKHYTISFRYYIEWLRGSMGIRFASYFCNDTIPIEPDKILQPTGYLNDKYEWMQFVVENYVAPDSASSFNFEVRTMKGATVYYDDFCFVEVEEAIDVSTDSMSFSAAAGKTDLKSVQVSAANIWGDIAISISGEDSGYFSVPAPLLANGAEKTLPVTYAPDSAGSHSATLTIAGGSVVRRVTLSGTAAANANDLPANITPIDSICTGADASPYLGQRVTIAGIVTAVTTGKSFFVQSGSGAGSGIYAHLRGNLVSTGDSVLVTGWIDEDSNLTKIVVNSDADVAVASDGHAPPPPTTITIDQMGKAYHGVLISIDSVVVAAHATDTEKYVVSRDGRALVVSREVAVTRPAAGAVVNITGVGFYGSNAHQLLPRSVGDVKIVGTSSATAAPTLEADDVAIYPNPIGDRLHVKAAYGVAKIEVYTLAGTIILQKEFSDSINISSLPSGDYIVRVTFTNGASLAKIIVKN
jgi:hypothetical protein